jgi:pSer/pThr/pTyr-binding forkhead associated (FHA) protein
VGELPLVQGRTIIGRTPENDLQIDSRFVSRHHCQIVTHADNCVVEDLNSTNGIVVKSRRVRRHNLNDGDVVTIGKHDLIYLDQRGERASGTGDHSAATVAAALKARGAVPQGSDAVAEDADQPGHQETQRM